MITVPLFSISIMKRAFYYCKNLFGVFEIIEPDISSKIIVEILKFLENASYRNCKSPFNTFWIEKQVSI